jgi:iron complex outermembrane recepter protein
MGKRVLLLTCAISALSGLTSAAYAAAAAPAAASDQASTVGEVIVTAEKRSVNVQQVPVAVTAFTSKQRAIEGISSVQDITNFTPGLTYSSQLDRPVMRGLARNNNIYLSDSAVAVYDDDLFTNSTFLVGRDDLFIDQVEVLLGPQGTLYGRNAIGGLINTLSKRPSDTFGGEVRVAEGNYAYTKVEGTVTGPIPLPGVDGLSFRLDAYFLNQDDGYFTNLHGGPSEGDVRHDPYGQLQLQYKNQDNDIWLSMYDLTFNNDRGGPGSLLGTPTSGPYNGALVGSGELFFNPNFGVLPGVGATSAVGGVATGPVLGSVTGLVPGLTNNPAQQNIRTFAHDLPTLIKVNGAYSFNFHWLHHFDGFDAKYVGGYSQYQYSLYTSDFINDNSSITSYQVPLDPAGPCATGALGPCSPLTVNPRQGFTYETHTKWFSHELTLSSTNDSPVQWIGGVYYYDEKDNNPETESAPDQPQIATPVTTAIFAGIVQPAIQNKQQAADYLLLDYQDDIRSTAIYGQVDWKFTDSLKLTGGLRYTYDQKSGIEEARYIAFQDLAPALSAEALGNHLPAVDITPLEISTAAAKGVTCLPFLQTKGGFAGDEERCLGDTSSALTGTAGIEWSPDRDTLAYFRYNRGYKAFGFNAGFIGPAPEAAPEFVDDYEIGYKKTVSRNLVIDADAFYYNYEDAQVPLSVPQGSVNLTEFVNIPKSISEGIELTINWAPVDHLNLSLVYALDHTVIESSCNVAANIGCYIDVQDPFALAPGAKPVAVAGSGSVLQSVKGEELPQAPQNKIAFNATYTFQFDPGDLILSGSYIWKDKSYAAIFDRNYTEAPAWDQVDVRATWSGDHDKYEVVLYVKNLFNTLGYDAAAYLGGDGGYVNAPIGGGNPTQALAYDLTPPRLYGIELHYKF